MMGMVLHKQIFFYFFLLTYLLRFPQMVWGQDQNPSSWKDFYSDQTSRLSQLEKELETTTPVLNEKSAAYLSWKKEWERKYEAVRETEGHLHQKWSQGFYHEGKWEQEWAALESQIRKIMIQNLLTASTPEEYLQREEHIENEIRNTLEKEEFSSLDITKKVTKETLAAGRRHLGDLHHEFLQHEMLREKEIMKVSNAIMELAYLEEERKKWTDDQIPQGEEENWEKLQEKATFLALKYPSSPMAKKINSALDSLYDKREGRLEMSRIPSGVEREIFERDLIKSKEFFRKKALLNLQNPQPKRETRLQAIQNVWNLRMECLSQQENFHELIQFSEEAIQQKILEKINKWGTYWKRASLKEETSPDSPDLNSCLVEALEKKLAPLWPALNREERTNILQNHPTCLKNILIFPNPLFNHLEKKLFPAGKRAGDPVKEFLHLCNVDLEEVKGQLLGKTPDTSNNSLPGKECLSFVPQEKTSPSSPLIYDPLLNPVQDLPDGSDLGAISSYTSQGYRILNNGLRNDLQGMMSYYNFEKFQLTRALDKLPFHPGTTYRHATCLPGNFPEGTKVVIDRAFLSTSLTDPGKLSGELCMEIRGFSGRHVEHYSTHRSEREVLFPPHVPFKVLGKGKYGQIILQELIPPFEWRNFVRKGIPLKDVWDNFY